MNNATDADYQTSVGREKTGAYVKEAGGDGMSESKGFIEYEMLSRERLSGLLETITSYRMAKNQCRQILSNAIDLIDERDRLAGIMRELVNAVKARDTHIGNGEVSPALATIARRLRDAVAKAEEAMQ